MALGARQADVEQAPLLRDLVRRLRQSRRQLLLLHARDEHRLELEPLRAVQRQQVDAAPRLSAVAEAALELRDEAGTVEVGELVGQPDEPREVVLANRLALAELVRRILEPAALLREPAHVRRRREPAQHEARALAAEERRALRRDAGLVQRLLEVDEPRVRAAEDRDVLVRDAERANPLDDEAPPRRRTACSSGSGPSARVARSVFSAPPSFGTSRFASASTCGDER